MSAPMPENFCSEPGRLYPADLCRYFGKSRRTIGAWLNHPVAALRLKCRRLTRQTVYSTPDMVRQFESKKIYEHD